MQKFMAGHDRLNNDSNIVIKKVFMSEGVNIIEVEIDPKCENNFDNTLIIKSNKMYATYKINTGTPTKIYNKHTKEQLTECTSVDNKTIFKINVMLNIATDKMYTVYLSEERALWADKNIINNRQKEWDNLGKLLHDYVYINNKKMGKYVSIHTGFGKYQDGYIVSTICPKCDCEQTESFTNDGKKNGSTIIRHKQLFHKQICNFNYYSVLNNFQEKKISEFFDETNYLNGKKNGACMQKYTVTPNDYFENTNEYVINCSFIDDIMDGSFEEHDRFGNYFSCEYENGQFHGKTSYKKDNITKYGDFVNGTGTVVTMNCMRRIRIDKFVDSTALDGVCEEYYDQVVSTLKRQTTYKKGVKEGVYMIFYSNEQLREVCNYSNDKISGEIRNYYPSGNLWFVTHCVNGLYDGDYKEYNNSDKPHLIQVGQFKNGIKVGLWKVSKNNKHYIDTFTDVALYLKYRDIVYMEVPFDDDGNIHGTLLVHYIKPNKKYVDESYDVLTRKFNRGEKLGKIKSLFY